MNYKNVSAREATKKDLEVALELVRQIEASIVNDLTETQDADADINWGHQGSAGYTRMELVEIRDRLYGIGEYAEEA